MGDTGEGRRGRTGFLRKVAVTSDMCSYMAPSSVAAFELSSCVNFVCHVWQCVVSACLSGAESTRMKPRLMIPSSDWMSCCSSL